MRHSFLIPTDPHSIVQHNKPGCLLLTIALATVLASCGKPDAPPAANAPATANVPAEQAAASVDPEIAATPLAATDTTWTPEGMENLLAPVALYPDAVLAQVLMAATNPQEVLDAGNWLLQNESLQGKALDAAGQQMGFTPPVLALIQFPQVVDMMCQDLDWTAELGQAYVNDQAGVLDAAQRLRVQAQEVGNLQSSEAIKVETVTEGDQQVVTINPPSPQVVYVPQYDPVAVYAPPPAAPVAAAATSSTTVVESKTGYSTGAMVTTGLLSFGAGILVSEIFDDDDDNYYYGGGGYWGRPPPYYPPYPYRPPYGNGFYPSHNYNRPGGNFSNNNVIINQNNNYWKNRQTGIDRSPISAARPNRPELQNLNSQAAKGPRRPAPAKGEGYAAARKKDSGVRNQQATARTGAANAQPTRPKVQGSYSGAKPGGAKASREAASRDVAKTTGAYAGARPDAQRSKASGANRDRSAAAGRPAARPSGAGNVDRGRAAPAAAKPKTPARPAAKPAQQSRPAAPQRQTGTANRSSSRNTALSGTNRGSNDRAASQRGRQSMPKGGASRSRQKSAGGGRRR